MKSQSTSLPWLTRHRQDGIDIISHGHHGETGIAEVFGNNEANAALIVRAVNAHEDLVFALREAQAALNGAPNTVGLHDQINTALAKAKGE